MVSKSEEFIYLKSGESSLTNAKCDGASFYIVELLINFLINTRIILLK
jgi:hypothetical protein